MFNLLIFEKMYLLLKFRLLWFNCNFIYNLLFLILKLFLEWFDKLVIILFVYNV